MARDLRRLSVYLVLAVVVGLGAACGGSDDGDDASADPTTTAPTTTLSPEAQDEAEVRALMEEWYASLDVTIDGAGGTPVAHDFLTGRFLEGIEQRLVEEADETFEPAPESRQVIESVDVDGDSAELRTCVYEKGTYRDATGDVIREPDSTFRFQTTAERTNDGWRLSDQHQVGTTEEGDQCDE